MEDKSEWEKFLIANIRTGKEENCSQKKDGNGSPGRKKDGFALKLEKAFKGLAQPVVISLEEDALEDNEDNTEVLEVEKENTETLIEGDEVALSNVFLVATEDNKGYAARLEEALKKIAQHTDTSSVEEITELPTEDGRGSVRRFEQDITITDLLDEGGEVPITRVDEEITEVLTEHCDASITTVDEEVTEGLAEGGEDLMLPLVREDNRLIGKKKRLVKCGLCPGCVQQDCKICR